MINRTLYIKVLSNASGVAQRHRAGRRDLRHLRAGGHAGREHAASAHVHARGRERAVRRGGAVALPLPGELPGFLPVQAFCAVYVYDAESSLGDAESLLGDAKSLLGDAESSLGDAKSSLGDVQVVIGARAAGTKTELAPSGAGTGTRPARVLALASAATAAGDETQRRIVASVGVVYVV